jgi:coenzyme PQQ precursor peptide PqqA
MGMKPLILLCFGRPTGRAQNRPLRCNKARKGFKNKRIHWRTFRHSVVYWPGRKSSVERRRAKMAWKAPKIVEVPCGMEINMYVSATRK